MSPQTSDARGFGFNRFFLRFVLLILFAGLGMLRDKVFLSTLTSLCVLAAGFCIGIAVLHRESLVSRTPTNWHEASAFLIIACMAFAAS